MTILIEAVFIAIVAIFLFSQVIFPLFGQGRFFWLFRKKEREIAQVEEEIEEEMVEDELKRIKKFKKTRKE